MQAHVHHFGGGTDSVVSGGSPGGSSPANITQTGAAFRVMAGGTDSTGGGAGQNLQPYIGTPHIIKT